MNLFQLSFSIYKIFRIIKKFRNTVHKILKIFQILRILFILKCVNNFYKFNSIQNTRCKSLQLLCNVQKRSKCQVYDKGFLIRFYTHHMKELRVSAASDTYTSILNINPLQLTMVILKISRVPTLLTSILLTFITLRCSINIKFLDQRR